MRNSMLNTKIANQTHKSWKCHWSAHWSLTKTLLSNLPAAVTQLCQKNPQTWMHLVAILIPFIITWHHQPFCIKNPQMSASMCPGNLHCKGRVSLGAPLAENFPPEPFNQNTTMKFKAPAKAISPEWPNECESSTVRASGDVTVDKNNHLGAVTAFSLSKFWPKGKI